jgi:hypothetical protein
MVTAAVDLRVCVDMAGSFQEVRVFLGAAAELAERWFDVTFTPGTSRRRCTERRRVKPGSEAAVK